jgi:hypothetical protein
MVYATFWVIFSQYNLVTLPRILWFKSGSNQVVVPAGSTAPDLSGWTNGGS